MNDASSGRFNKPYPSAIILQKEYKINTWWCWLTNLFKAHNRYCGMQYVDHDIIQVQLSSRFQLTLAQYVKTEKKQIKLIIKF